MGLMGLMGLMGMVLVMILTVVSGGSALAWQEGSGTDWWYVDASYGDYHDSVPLVIEINGNPSDGQVLTVGDTIAITGDLHAVAQSCGGDGNGAYTEWLLEVAGPSGSGSMGDFNYDHTSGCAVADEDTTLTITYVMTASGTHTIYMSSYAAVSQYWADVAEDSVEGSLTFEVGTPRKADILKDSGVPGKGLDKAPGLQKPFNLNSKAADHAGKK